MADSRTLMDIPMEAICLVVLVTFGVLGKNATFDDATFYFESELDQTCDLCPAHDKCALVKREE